MNECASRPLSPRVYDQREFRDTIGHYASGVTVITGMVDHSPLGFTCQSFYSVSIEPPLVSFSVMASSTTYPKIRESGSFTVNVLAQHQGAVASQFARSGTDKWAGIDWSPSSGGNPIIGGSLMWLDCEIWAEHEAGDHQIVIGRVRDMSSREWNTREPLLFYKGRYRNLSEVEPSI